MTTLTIDPAALGNRALTLTIGPMPDAAAEPVRVALTECLAFVPRWVREFEVYFADRQHSEWAETKLQSRYRRAEMFLNEAWLKLSPRKRRQVVLHELAHVWLMPFHGATHDAFDAMLNQQPETVSKTCYEVFEAGMETTAEDLAHLFDEMIESGSVAPVSIDLRTGARTTPETSSKRKRGSRA
ncbi:MAG: hypothetical protein KJZ65_06535 [Phycisphaerales bacterium]|nr:hypothetical protein [Phycisphaerales bacterium]